MARGKSLVSSVALLNWSTSEPEAMPWNEIQNVVGKAFTAAERKEIFHCALEYHSEAALQEQGAEQKRTNEVLSELCEHIFQLRELIDRGIPKPGRSEYDRSELDPEDVKAFDAICIALSKERSLRDDLRELRAAVERVQMSLDDTGNSSLKASALQPHSAGLAAFIIEALKDATWRDARSSPNSWNAAAREYRRWGVPIGPQSKKFLRFIAIVVGEDVKLRQIERAFERAKELIREKAVRAAELGNTEAEEAIREHPLFSENME